MFSVQNRACWSRKLKPRLNRVQKQSTHSTRGLSVPQHVCRLMGWNYETLAGAAQVRVRPAKRSAGPATAAECGEQQQEEQQRDEDSVMTLDEEVAEVEEDPKDDEEQQQHAPPPPPAPSPPPVREEESPPSPSPTPRAKTVKSPTSLMLMTANDAHY